MKIRRWLRVRKGRIPRNIGKNKKTIKKENSITKQTQEQERKRKECRQRKAKRPNVCRSCYYFPYCKAKETEAEKS